MLSRLLDFFNVDRPWDVTWAHRVNSRAELEKYCASDVMMIEGDILVSGGAGKLFMSHSAPDQKDLALEEWLRRILEAGKGVKLDFKRLRSDQENPLVIEPYFKVLERVWDPRVPIILNADVIQGPNGDRSEHVPLDPHEFIELYDEYRRRCNPDVILSLGWTTEYTEKGRYTSGMIEEMLEVDSLHGGQVTFAVRASFVRNSWGRVRRLLNDPRHTLTVWETKGASPELLSWMKRMLNPKKVFYDMADPTVLLSQKKG
ncbi:MAG: hypothetical protein BMS9Abin34_200 [Patescibacteria group bacterium]|nr:MAG: hypothetical protein BMS9Abin34_200 [Patescibacteria group bacterium]